MEQSSLLKDLEICAKGKNSNVVSHPHRRILQQGSKSWYRFHAPWW